MGNRFKGITDLIKPMDEEQEPNKNEEQSEPKKTGGNTVGTALKVIGVLVAITGVIAMSYADDYALLIAGFIGGVLFIGFGEVIHLLQKIVDRQSGDN
ncbi:MAG: hypothetical protein FWG36_06845 [Oscillospiraceae bacterium]|nr:hypothetical protein [Oscillospiraceae bacterium]